MVFNTVADQTCNKCTSPHLKNGADMLSFFIETNKKRVEVELPFVFKGTILFHLLSLNE